MIEDDNLHNTLAPIALFVYNRADHTEKTLTALRRNELAPRTTLIIFSDGPKSAADTQAVEAVRDVIRKIDGFKVVRLEESENNLGLATSIIEGVTRVVNEFGRVIVIEDDLVTHPATLDYFNTALDFYASSPGVFSISGYNHPSSLMVIPPDYKYDVYAIPRMQCWGWATWKEKWAFADFSVPDFQEFMDSQIDQKAYKHLIGSDSLQTLQACMRGDKDVWACRWVYTHFRHNAVCICPTKSLINNIGLDGSGSNCGVTNSFEQDVLSERSNEWNFPKHVFVDQEIFDSFMMVMDTSRNTNLHLPPRVEIGTNDSMNENSDSVPHKHSLFERIRYWAFRPRQLLERIQERYVNSKNVEIEPAEADSFITEPTTPLIRIGSDYGGWHVPANGLGPQHFVVSAGAGEDISFDIELATRFGCQILILDPTPRAVTHYEMVRDGICNQKAVAINNSKTNFYHATEADIETIRFKPLGLWHRVETLSFFAPANPAHVSHSIGNLHESQQGFEAECVSLSEVVTMEKRTNIDVLKLDIEGAEFAVLEHMLTTDIRPNFILVEFHAGKDENELVNRTRTNALINRLAEEGYRLVQNTGWDYVLERQLS